MCQRCDSVSGSQLIYAGMAAVLMLTAAGNGLADSAGPPAAMLSSEKSITRVLTLDACLKMAMENNRERPASRLAVAMAEARHRQALAGYWPQITLNGTWQHLDEAPNFIFPSFNVPATSAGAAGGTSITIPAGVLGPNATSLPVNVPAQTIPQQDVRLMDPDSFVASADVSWLLYGGGLRRGQREQTGAFLKMAEEASRRTDLEIVDSVKRLYAGAVLARQLYRTGEDTLARLGATLTLTETLYKGGSGTVKKTDYLDNRVMAETMRSVVALLKKNEEMSQAALANTMGLPWNESVQPTDDIIAVTPYAGSLKRLVGSAYCFNPDWKRLEAGIAAAEGMVRTAQSGDYPKLVLTGNLHKWWNHYTAGLASDTNKDGWNVGVNVEIPLFDGFLTRNKVAEARLRVEKLKQEQLLFKEGIGLMLRDTFLSLIAAQTSHEAAYEAMKSAAESRKLNTRAYENGLVDTEKVIRAQIVEALMTAQYDKACYDCAALKSRIDMIVGAEVMKQLGID